MSQLTTQLQSRGEGVDVQCLSPSLSLPLSLSLSLPQLVRIFVFGGIGGAVRGVRFVFEMSAHMCFPLVILQDRQPESQERLRLHLLTISNGRVLRIVTAYLTIRDDDGEITRVVSVFMTLDYRVTHNIKMW